MTQKVKQLTLLFLGFLAAIGLDQWTKYLAIAHLKDQPAYVIWDGVFEFFYSENRGAAFGMLQGRHLLFGIIAVIVVCLAVYAVIKMPSTRHYLPLYLIAMFISAGAMGNMIDRFVRGYVVDFLYFSLIDFPIFNVADCYVTISMFFFLILFLFVYKEEDLECLSFRKGGKS